MTLPIVAIVGRPNVGKSRLFNRFVRSARSIVADQPGVTRDRIYADTTLDGVREDREIVLVDTGGFDPASEDPIMRGVVEQTQLAIDEADVIVFMVDGRAGLMPEDHDIAKLLRKNGKPMVLAVNKVDGPKQDTLMHEFHRMGIEDMFPISAAHGRNVGELAEHVVELLPEQGLDSIEEVPNPGEDPSVSVGPVRVAVVGRPNAGKSSLVNRLLGEDRHLVSEVAGTTIDSVDSLVRWRDREILFIDTAGIRRKRSIAMRVEKYSVIAALKGLDRSDVALLLLDATEPVARQDARVAAFAEEKGKAVVIVVSKWDCVPKGTTKKAFTDKLHQELAHLRYAPIVFTSSKSGEGVERLLPTVIKVHKEYGKRVPTGQLNRFAEAVMADKPPPAKKGKRGRVYYISQVDVRPPRFILSVNNPELFHFSYRRFIVNAIRKAHGFSGSPLIVSYKGHVPDKKKRVEKGSKKVKTSRAKQATADKRARKQGKTPQRRILNTRPKKGGGK